MFKKKTRKSCQVKQQQPKKLHRAQTLNTYQRQPSIYLNMIGRTYEFLNKNPPQNQNPSNIHLLLNHHNHHSHTHAQPHHRNQEQQQSMMAVRQQFTTEQLTNIFNTLSNDGKHIYPDDLMDALDQINQCDYKRYEMIKMLDKDNKGCITLEEFVDCFENDVIAGEIFRYPKVFVKRAKWREALDQNYQCLNVLKDVEFCRYVKKKLMES